MCLIHKHYSANNRIPSNQIKLKQIRMKIFPIYVFRAQDIFFTLFTLYNCVVKPDTYSKYIVKIFKSIELNQVTEK